MNVEKGVHISNFIFNSSAKVINNKFVFILFAEFCFIASRLPSANLPFIRPTTKFVFAFFCSVLFSLYAVSIFSPLLLLLIRIYRPPKYRCDPLKNWCPIGFWILSNIDMNFLYDMWLEICYACLCVCVGECLCVGLIRKHFFRLFANAANSRCFVFFGLTEIRNEAYCNWAPFRG